MKQKTELELIAEIRLHTVGNRREVEDSKYAGCVSCCAVFNSKQVTEWKDEWNAPEKHNRVKRWTAKCPECGSASVIGSSTGLLENQAYLPCARHFLQEQANMRR